jgi:hypothetical protein
MLRPEAALGPLGAAEIIGAEAAHLRRRDVEAAQGLRFSRRERVS